MGAAFVWVGAMIVPSYSKNIAYGLAVFGIFYSGVTFFIALTEKIGWLMWGSFCGVAGVCTIVYLIHQGLIEVE